MVAGSGAAIAIRAEPALIRCCYGSVPDLYIRKWLLNIFLPYTHART